MRVTNTEYLNKCSSLPGCGSMNRVIQAFPDWRRIWKNGRVVSRASEDTDEQIVN